MIRFILATFLVMGWAFWELSGGSDFEPATRTTAQADQAEAEVPEIATRSSEPSLGDVAIPARLETSIVDTRGTTAATEEEIAAALTEAMAQEEAAETPPASVAAADATAPVAPETEVATATTAPLPCNPCRTTGSRVNMRSGPGTGNAVVVTLDPYTDLDPLEMDEAVGWVRVRVATTGTEGWIADYLLTDG